MKEGQHILLLGGSGFIGTNIALSLLEAGHRITILDRSLINAVAFERFPTRCSLICANLLDFDLVKNVLVKGGFSTVIHLVTNVVPGSSFSEFLMDSDINIKMGFRLLEAIHQAGIPNFIYFSSGGTVYGNNGREINDELAPRNPISLYGWYKSAMEQYIQTYAHHHPFNYAILRPSNPFGYYQNLYGRQGFIAVAMGKILQNEKIEIWGNGNTIRDYIFIEDLSNIITCLIDKGFERVIFNIGTGEGHSLNEIVQHLREVTQQPVFVEYLEARQVDVSTNILNVNAVREYLSHYSLATTSLRDGIQKMWNRVQKASISTQN